VATILCDAGGLSSADIHYIEPHATRTVAALNDRIAGILDYLLRSLDRHGMHKQTGPTARPAPID
jgi:hypothetical protein